MPNTPQLRHPAAVATQTWVNWAMFVLFFLFVVGALLSDNGRLDTYTWRATRWFFGDQKSYTWAGYHLVTGGKDVPWYRTEAPPYGSQFFQRTQIIWVYARQMGETWVTLSLALFVAYYNRRGWKAAALVGLVTAGTGLFSTLVRLTAGRLRPVGELASGIRNDGENVWVLFRGFYTLKDLSFPSGHATLAFGLAAVMSYLSPQTRWLWIAWAGLCAWSRVIMQAHFYADVAAGAAIGWGVGMLLCVMGDQWLAMLPDWPARMRNDLSESLR